MTAPRVRFCGNCNARLTRYRKRWCEPCSKLKEREAQYTSRDRIRHQFEQYKISLGCTRCGYNKCAAALDFHHRDPTQKERRVPIAYYTDLGQAELLKCDLLCKNCHYEEHFSRPLNKAA